MDYRAAELTRTEKDKIQNFYAHVWHHDRTSVL